MENHSPSVNLLKTKGNNFSDKFIKWALTIGRMVIILTETIALVAFLYRFILDRQIIDQRERINQKAAQVKLYEPQEKEYRNIQERLQLITSEQNKAAESVLQVSDIISIAPSGVTFNLIGVTTSRLTISTNVGSISSLTSFVNALKRHPNIASVSIDKIENKTLNTSIIVLISAKLKNAPVEVAVP